MVLGFRGRHLGKTGRSLLLSDEWFVRSLCLGLRWVGAVGGCWNPRGRCFLVKGGSFEAEDAPL